MTKFLLLLLGIALFFFSCRSVPVIQGAESDAEKSYKEGLYYLEKGDLVTAEARFMKVISDFSYSNYEPYAAVALGDTYYKKEEFASAITLYETFLKRHPDHEKAPWAELQKANSYFAQRPSDFFILPNPSERDVAVVEKAAELYRAYLKKYPNDSNRNLGLANLEKAELILIEKDLRTAEFYCKRKKCGGVQLRLKHIADNFTVTTEKNRLRINRLREKCHIDLPSN